MSKLGNLLTLAKGASPAFWYKLAFIVLAFVAYTGGVYAYGVHNCQMDHEKQKTEEAEKKTKEVVAEVHTRLPEVQKIDGEAVAKQKEIDRLKDKLDEALKNRPANPTCDLSDDEFNGVRDLAAQTRSPK